MSQSLLESLVIVSEKAANIARKCRQDEHLFKLLVEEKKEDEANPRFVRDFKTLADVLIQETVRHDVGERFPELKGSIKGEESNVFCNTLGENIVVEVKKSEEDTMTLLAVVLNGDDDAARSLAAEVHNDVNINDVITKSVPDYLDWNVDVTDIGIWIDPIDSTAEYISGNEIVDENNIAICGLKCVTVLIGVYNLTTGIPIMGVVNQPFYENTDNKWQGRCFWGYTGNEPRASLDNTLSTTNIICISSSEGNDVQEKLKENGYKLVEAAGAGYKVLTTITGQSDAYLLTRDSTFKWDTCGPQAILHSLGGNVVNYDALRENRVENIDYLSKECRKGGIQMYCNQGGILAYRNKEVLERIMIALNTN